MWPMGLLFVIYMHHIGMFFLFRLNKKNVVKGSYIIRRFSRIYAIHSFRMLVFKATQRSIIHIDVSPRDVEVTGFTVHYS